MEVLSLKKMKLYSGFADPEYFGAARRTGALYSRFAVFHRSGLCTLDLSFTTAFDTIAYNHAKGSVGSY